MSPLLRFLYEAASIHMDSTAIKKVEIAPLYDRDEIDQYTCEHIRRKEEIYRDYIEYTCMNCGKKW
jgi:hypothetical protein